MFAYFLQNIGDICLMIGLSLQRPSTPSFRRKPESSKNDLDNGYFILNVINSCAQYFVV